MVGVEQLQRFRNSMTERLRLTSVATASHSPVHDNLANLARNHQWSQYLVSMVHAVKNVHEVLSVDLDSAIALG